MVGLCGANGTAISNTTALSNVVVKLSVVQDTYAVVADNADGWPFGAGATLSRSSVRIVVARAKEDQQDCDFNLFVDSSRLSPFLIFVVVMAFLLPVSIIAFFVGRRFWRQRRNYKTIA
jgi:hypothetical protein